VTTPRRTVWFVVPQGVGDPARVSGGNVFDLRVGEGLRRVGWHVRTVEVGADAASNAADALARIPAGALALIDGLVALEASEAIHAVVERARVVLLVHMVAAAFEDADARAVEAERRILPRARHVVVTSAWARDELVQRGIVMADRVTVSPPGADDAPLSAGTPAGTALLCVGVVAPHKGQDTLIEALADLTAGPEWTCTIAGSLEVRPSFARTLAERAAEAGISERIRWTGVLGEDELDTAYAAADLLVAPSRTESYGIAVGDALRRGIPVVASRVGGIPEAVQPGRAAVLVPPGDAAALADALRRWMHDPALRSRLRQEARRTAPDRRNWSDTARALHQALEELP
jgi:glycosyltransferase involved in cell wall biosynthesis